MRVHRGCFVASLILVFLTACRTSTWSRQETLDWYSQHRPMVRWVGYQGSDKDYHHFIARVFDTWRFIRIPRGDLRMEDERPLQKSGTTPIAHYTVDLGTNFEKIDFDAQGRRF